MTDITVLIIDDQPPMLHALQTFIENEDGVPVVGTAEDGEAAVEAAKPLQPDPILMGIKMPRLNGIEVTRKIVSEILGTRVLALTVSSTLDYIALALRAGIVGYLAKDTRPDKILTAIRNAMDDSLPPSPSVVRLMVRQVIGGVLDAQIVAGATAMEVRFTPREISVLQFLGNGLSNREIAKKMYASEGPVKAYPANAYAELGVRDRPQAVIRGFELGIVSSRLPAGE